MIDNINSVLSESNSFEIKNTSDLENFRLKFLSKNGIINQLFEDFKKIPNNQKREIGGPLNQLKTAIQQKFDTHKELLESQDNGVSDDFDGTLPTNEQLGSRHPLKIVQNTILEIFSKLGFTTAYGPEIESDWYNFSALNFPENHPARDMQDTFFVDKDHALRTHTTSVQVRVLENCNLPVRMVSPGRVYRNEAISARAHCFFHQIDGCYVDKNVSFADLKQTLFTFVQQLFGSDIKIRFRPSYFPFTEVSAEMDCTCILCSGNGCNVCKHSGWVEILGCGMIDPNVLQNCGIDPEVYSGFAFGMGLERITMLKYNIKDLRLFSENNIKFLNQFTGIYD
jgi:phenylalanyl-tRNA synthetase alpha chain